MQRFLSRLKNFGRMEDGPTAVEYAVMLALVLVVVLAAIVTLGQNMNNALNKPEPAVEVKEVTNDNGSVIVVMPDGTKKVFVVDEPKEGQIQVKTLTFGKNSVVVVEIDNTKREFKKK